MNCLKLLLPALLFVFLSASFASDAKAQYPLAVVPVQPVAPVVVGYTAERRGLFGRRVVYRPVVSAPVVAAPVVTTPVVASPVVSARVTVPVAPVAAVAPVTVARPVVVAQPSIAVPVTTYRVPTVPVVPAPIQTYRVPIAPLYVW